MANADNKYYRYIKNRKLNTGDGNPVYGNDGNVVDDSPELRVADGFIQYRKGPLSDWESLISITDISGEDVHLSIGSVSIGENASASITGNYPDLLLNLVLKEGAKGDTGESLMLRKYGEYLQYKKESDTSWINLVPLSEITPALDFNIVAGTVTSGEPDSEPVISFSGAYPTFTFDATIPKGSPGERGDNGKEITLRKNSTHIQWKLGTDGVWTNLIALEELTGPVAASPTIMIGTVTNLPAGSDPTASISGVNPNYTLNIGIPSGTPGSDASVIIESEITSTGENPVSGSAIYEALDNKLNKGGDTMTGVLTTVSPLTTENGTTGVRNVYVSSAAPTIDQGEDGDIWIVIPETE